jgi:hypothetical protein
LGRARSARIQCQTRGMLVIVSWTFARAPPNASEFPSPLMRHIPHMSLCRLRVPQMRKAQVLTLNLPLRHSTSLPAYTKIFQMQRVVIYNSRVFGYSVNALGIAGRRLCAHASGRNRMNVRRSGPLQVGGARRGFSDFELQAFARAGSQ